MLNLCFNFQYGHAGLMLCSSQPILVAVGFITVVMAPMWHMALHNTNLYGTLVRSYSLGCCSQSSVEASGLNLLMYKLFGLVHICCHLGLYTLGHLGLYIFVAIWAIARPANNYYYVIIY